MGKLYQASSKVCSNLDQNDSSKEYVSAIGELLRMCEQGESLISSEYVGQVQIVKGHIQEILIKNGVQA